MTVQRYQVFGWANPVEGGDGPFGGVYVKESDYDALAARLAEAERLLRDVCDEGVLYDRNRELSVRIIEFLRTTDSAEPRETV